MRFLLFAIFIQQLINQSINCKRQLKLLLIPYAFADESSYLFEII